LLILHLATAQWSNREVPVAEMFAHIENAKKPYYTLGTIRENVETACVGTPHKSSVSLKFGSLNRVLAPLHGRQLGHMYCDGGWMAARKSHQRAMDELFHLIAWNGLR
jgi:hypothetical protein